MPRRAVYIDDGRPPVPAACCNILALRAGAATALLIPADDMLGVKFKWLDRLSRWFVPINLRPLLQVQCALDAAAAFALTVLFLCELARPGTLTSRDTLRHMSRPELRRYLAFYLWYAFMYLAQMTVSLLLFMDVRNVKYNVDGRRRTILTLLVFSPTLLVNLLLAAANVLYLPWSPLGPFYILHTLFLAPYWLYAFRYYHWLGDSELVLFETPLVESSTIWSDTRPPGPAVDALREFTTATADGWPEVGRDLGHLGPSRHSPNLLQESESSEVSVAQLVHIEAEEYQLSTFSP